MSGKSVFGFVSLLIGIVVLFVLALIFLRVPTDVNAPVQTTPTGVVDHINSTSSFSLYRRGRLIADENHRSYRIEVSQSSRTLELLSGYDDVVTQKYTYPNSLASYEEFVYALHNRGLAGVADMNKYQTNGVCPDGLMSIYEVRDGSEVVSWQWASDCGTGTENSPDSLLLFQNQIPDFSQKISGFIL